MMKLQCPPIVLLSFLVSGLMAQPAAYAQQEPLDAQAVALQSQLERLNENIERIAHLLERSLEGQQLELLMQRVDRGSSRLSVAEQNLRSVKATRNSIDNEKKEIEARLVQMAEALDRGDVDMTVEDIEQYTRQLDLQLQLLKDQVRSADRQINELENEVMSQRENIRDWQDYIDEELTSRQ
jgi:hypothetical protein